MADNNYKSKDIVVLEGLEAVRLRPGMYIGTTSIKGLHHLLWEIVDNSIDEVSNGFGKRISITLHVDGSVTVEDDGRGIPVDIHPQLKKSGVEVVFTQLHAGGKFDNANYGYSGGLHGVGASVTNALSSWLKVTVNKNKKKYYMEFASFKDEKGKWHSGIPVCPLKEIGVSVRSGTKVTFMPDSSVFETVVFDYATIAKRLRELAYLNKGIAITLTDERLNKCEDFFFEGGLKDFALYMIEGKNPLYKEPIMMEAESKIVKLQASVIYTDSYTDNSFSYVNNIPTTEGGMHETGFKMAFTKTMNEIARKFGLLKDKEANLMGEDFREGMTVLLSIKMRNVQFEGQTKTKLGNPEAKTEVDSLICAELRKFFEVKANQKIAEIIINKAKGAAKVREAARKAKEITRQKNSIDNFNLVGKLAACTTRKNDTTELFIVEGDSAGGSAKQARDRTFQAILPLRGKPLNAEKKRLDQVLANEEVRTIISALETGIGEDFDLSKLRYNKVIILSDADQDGFHIRAILLTFFFRYMKNLVTDGHVYIGLPPLYRVYKKDYSEYVYSDAELPDAIKRAGKNYQIQRFKGLGEMNPEQLWDTTMDPAKRSLLRVTIDDVAQAERIVTTLMGDDIESRKGYLNAHCNFNREDTFLKEVDK